jgi:hypothetical protein
MLYHFTEYNVGCDYIYFNSTEHQIKTIIIIMVYIREIRVKLYKFQRDDKIEVEDNTQHSMINLFNQRV